jgi:hypothetical protein
MVVIRRMGEVLLAGIWHEGTLLSGWRSVNGTFSALGMDRRMERI